MLEDFQDFHAKEKEETRDWADCDGFLVIVPIAYLAAVLIAVTVATLA